MNNNDKHAFLIMVHNNKEQLINLIKLLDYPDNELYIHIDKKVHLIDDEELLSICSHSKVHILRTVKVAWGAYSQIKCELALLQEAIKTKHIYYHLISGSDVPLKSNKELHRFFYENRGKEFIHFQGQKVEKSTIEHVQYYHLLQEYTNAYGPAINKLIRATEHVFVGIQKMLRINRWDNSLELQKGSQWFSITHECAAFIILKANIIKKCFKYSFCCDELFLQTMVINSNFKANLYKPSFDDNYLQCVRIIDWTRGKPYVFQTTDIDELLTSDALFARKCSPELTKSIRDLIYQNNKI